MDGRCTATTPQPRRYSSYGALSMRQDDVNILPASVVSPVVDVRRHGIHTFPHQRLRERFLVGGSRGDVRCAVDVSLFRSSSTATFRVDMSVHATFFDLAAFLERRLSAALLQAEGGTAFDVYGKSEALSRPRASMLWCGDEGGIKNLSCFGMHLSDVLTLKERSGLTHHCSTEGATTDAGAVLCVALSTGTERREVASRQTIEAFASAAWKCIVGGFLEGQCVDVVFRVHPQDAEEWSRCAAAPGAEGANVVALLEERRLLGSLVALLGGCSPDELGRYDAFVSSDEVDADRAAELWTTFVQCFAAKSNVLHMTTADASSRGPSGQSEGCSGVVAMRRVPLDTRLVDGMETLPWWTSLCSAATRFLCASCTEDVGSTGVGTPQLSLAGSMPAASWVDIHHTTFGCIAAAARCAMGEQQEGNDCGTRAVTVHVSIKPLLTVSRARSRTFVDAAGNYEELLSRGLADTTVDAQQSTHTALAVGVTPHWPPRHPLGPPVAVRSAGAWPADVLVALEGAYVCLARTIAASSEAAVTARLATVSGNSEVPCSGPSAVAQAQRLWWQWRVAAFLARLGYCCPRSAAAAAPRLPYDVLLATEVQRLLHSKTWGARGGSIRRTYGNDTAPDTVATTCIPSDVGGVCLEVAAFLVQLHLSGMLDPHRYPGKDESTRLRTLCVDIRLRWESHLQHSSEL